MIPADPLGWIPNTLTMFKGNIKNNIVTFTEKKKNNKKLLYRFNDKLKYEKFICIQESIFLYNQ